jgi:hypothetical protein
MRYVIISARFDERAKSGRIEIHDRAQARTVVVTRRALLSIASPPRANEARLLQNLDVFCGIALSPETAPDKKGEVTITAKHVRTWRGTAVDEPVWSWRESQTPSAERSAFPHSPKDDRGHRSLWGRIESPAAEGAVVQHRA